MNSNEVFLNLKELGRVNSKRQELRDYCKQNCDEIIRYLPQQILNSDGADVLDYLFNGLPENSVISNSVKTKIINIVLKAFRTEVTSTKHCSDIISRVCLELPRCNPDDLVQWSNDCVHTILTDDDVNMIWRDILPECLSAISSHDHVKQSGTQMSSLEYSEKCVTTLCQCQWKEKQLIQLTAMFKDMQLSRDEHKQVVRKICSYLNDVSVESVPPLLHQLLKLCKTHNIDIVLAYLSEYFKTRLYSKIEPPENDSEGTTVDLEEIEMESQEELSRCLSTCLYHITQGAADPEFVAKRLKLWPTSQILRNPFLVDIALALADKGLDFKSTCLGVIKDSIEQSELISIKSKQSAWLREVLPSDVNVAAVLRILTTESANHRSLTVSGLIALGFTLLATPRTKPVASACWSHGRLVLVRLAKTQPETASHILSKLGDKDLNLKQYSDCLYVLCKLSPVSIERCPQLTLLLEAIHPSAQGFVSAARSLDAVHPLLSFSTKVRDSMLMLCRKKLYSRDAMDRCVAVSGFMTLLRHIKLPNSSNTSATQVQDQFSAQSIFTQLSIDLHATQSGAPVTSRVRNESMCLEVISIMRRCLIQDAAVKQVFYIEIFGCLKQKGSLHEPVLESLYEHFFKYLAEDDHGSPILWNKCVQISARDATLTEPIGYLIYGISKFLQGEEEEDLEDILTGIMDNSATSLKNKLADILDRITGRDLVDMETEYTGVTTATPESKAKYLIVQQVLQCYEGLIAFHIHHCTVSSKNMHTHVLKLYKAYNTALDFAKATPKGNKKVTKANLNETDKSVQMSGKDKSKKSNMAKDKMAFKPLPCLWDLEFCARIIELLYSENVTWCNTEHRNLIRTRYEFHLFVIRNVQSVVTEKELPRHDVTTFAISICKILFKRCIVRFDDVNDFNEKVALACIELFKDCLTLLLSQTYAIKINKLLPAIFGTQELDVSQSIAAILESVLKAFTSINSLSLSQPAANDVLTRKLNASLSHLAATVLNIPITSSCPRLLDAITDIEKFIKSNKIDISILLPPLLGVRARDHQDSAILDPLFDRLNTALGVIDTEESAIDDVDNPIYPYIDARTGHGILAHVCSHLALTHQVIAIQLKYCQQLVLAALHSTPNSKHKLDKDLKDINKSLVIQLCQLTKHSRNAGALRCTVGAGTDRLLLNLIRLYTLLKDFVKHLSSCVTKDDVSMLHNIRLERLMKQSGKPLSTSMDTLIDYLVKSQPQSLGPSAVLRDTKLVPRLVLQAETYKKHVLMLAHSTKIDYQQHMPVGTARDFKIKAPLLAAALENMAEEDPDVSDAESVILSNREHEDGSQQPKRKRIN